jgi:conjugative transfer pilus assembly protein TraH
MCKNHSKLFLVISILGICISSYAGVSSDLGAYFDKLGVANNITLPTAYQGQEAGYYSGGSLYARTPVREVQIMNLELPGYRSGCGGIDLFMGGFSFINSKQLIGMLKNVLNNAAGYAFTLALESATPQIANVLKYLQEQAAKINSMNVNSCETAVGLVGSIWPRTQEAQRRVCEDIGMSQQKSLFSDYAAAKQGCGNEGKLSDTLGRAQGAHKDKVLTEGNLAWNSIKRNGYLSTDQELAQLFMSLSGSIIIRKNGAGDEAANTFSYLPSLATNMKLLGAMLNGGTATIYNCDNSDKCLSPTSTTITISEKDSLKKRVRTILKKMTGKFFADTRLDASEKWLLESTTLPVQKMLNVQMAFYKEEHIVDIGEYSDIIAIDILFQYLIESLHVIRVSATILQYPEDIMNRFIDNIDAARRALKAEQKSVYAEITTTNSIVRQTKVIEDMLASSFSENMNATMKWARGEL